MGVDGFEYLEKRGGFNLLHGIPSLLQVDAREGSNVLAVINDEDVQKALPDSRSICYRQAAVVSK